MNAKKKISRARRALRWCDDCEAHHPLCVRYRRNPPRWRAVWAALRQQYPYGGGHALVHRWLYVVSMERPGPSERSKIRDALKAVRRANEADPYALESPPAKVYDDMIGRAIALEVLDRFERGVYTWWGQGVIRLRGRDYEILPDYESVKPRPKPKPLTFVEFVTDIGNEMASALNAAVEADIKYRTVDVLEEFVELPSGFVLPIEKSQTKTRNEP